MAYGLPGVSGQNVAYAILCGGSLTAALVYAYKTMISDGERFTDRLAEMNARPKDPWEPKPWPATENAHSLPVAEEATEANEETSVLAHTESLSTAADVAETAGSYVTTVAETESTEVSAVAEVAEAESPGVAPETGMLLASEVATEALTEAVSEVAAEVVLATAAEEPSAAEAAADPIENNGTTPTQEAELPLVEVAPEEASRADTPVDVEA
ncbi:protein MGARP-like [Scleropages formosus]|uniref:protein MGARP-like n=1 Tax=Scleropages formosus TaxID=113540 RepID=UPI00087847EA|nr:protein MGARP [Scleropages formosus]